MIITELEKFAGMVALIDKGKEDAKKEFNPNNEPIIVMKVIEKKVLKRLRPWPNQFKLNKERTKEGGFKVYDKIPPSEEEENRNQSHYQKAGILDRNKCQDPNLLDPDTGLPMWRFFEKGEIMLLIKNNAIWQEYQEYAMVMPDFKNVKDEDTDKLPCDWAEENEVLSDESGILIPKYHEIYSKNANTVMGLAERMIQMQDRIDALEAEKAGNGHG